MLEYIYHNVSCSGDKMRWSVIVILVFAVILAYSFVAVSLGPIDPLGRLSFVKLENPDMYPGHPHSELLAQYAEKTGSKCALVLHFAGSSTYSSYDQDTPNSNSQNGVYIIEVAFIDTQGGGSSSLSQINLLDSLKVALFGVPDGRYKYMSDGVVYNSYDAMMSHVNTLAKQHGQKGAIPTVYHGTVRTDNPILDPGCGFPLYFQILEKTYGIVPAYVYTITGMIFPYLNSPYRNFELMHSSELQYYYNNGLLNIDYKNSHVNTGKYYGQTSNNTD
jgi:hypothetical protein